MDRAIFWTPFWHAWRNRVWYFLAMMAMVFTAASVVFTTPRYAPMRYLVERVELSWRFDPGRDLIGNELRSRVRSGELILGSSRRRLDQRVLERAISDGYFVRRSPAGSEYNWLDARLTSWLEGPALTKIVVTDPSGNLLFEQQLPGDRFTFASPADIPPTPISYTGSEATVSVQRRSTSGIWEISVAIPYALNNTP